MFSNVLSSEAISDLNDYLDRSSWDSILRYTEYEVIKYNKLFDYAMKNIRNVDAGVALDLSYQRHGILCQHVLKCYPDRYDEWCDYCDQLSDGVKA